ncbi:GtrA family protein [Haloprofundus salilacus]|uniref:GtrA family protein n=1 Tax=Haloprofundus salilacus TaxID=2876190 RepID=UPI001CCE7F16|nr:GtrA family protein [Haloprofundus salilacus]
MSQRSTLRERLAAAISLARFGQFVSVGAVGAVCDFAVLLLLSQSGIAATLAAALGVPGAAAELAKLGGIETAIVVMFLLNEHWTFDGEGVAGTRASVRRLGRSHLVRAGGVGVQLLVFSVVYNVLFVDLTFESVDLWLVVASGVGIVAGMGVNFVTESLFTWRVQRPG